MTSSRSRITVLGLALALAGCLTIGGDDTSDTELDPVAMQNYLQRNFQNTAALVDAISRVIQKANGGNPPGVNFTTTSTGASGTVTVDLKGDGSDIALVNAALTYNVPAQGIAGGAALVVNSIDAPSTTGTANANVAVGGGGSTVTLSSGSANLNPTDGPDLAISSANLTITPSLSNPTVLGSANFAASGKSGTAFFESNGSGGWRIRVASPDFTGFTVP